MYSETDEKDLVREDGSKALVPSGTKNTNPKYKAYQQRLNQQKSLLSQKGDINSLRQEVAEIKDMLKELINNAT